MHEEIQAVYVVLDLISVGEALVGGVCDEKGKIRGGGDTLSIYTYDALLMYYNTCCKLSYSS